jgi:hypothetical protein
LEIFLPNFGDYNLKKKKKKILGERVWTLQAMELNT